MRTVPGAHEAVTWNQPFYGHEARAGSSPSAATPAASRPQFFRGASLDPVPLKASKHDEVRYRDIYEDNDLGEDQLACWIQQASDLPGEQLGAADLRASRSEWS